MARKGLPKHIIKKYGITKKAWRIHRGKSSKKKTKRKGKVKKMARRRRYTKKKTRRSTKRRIPLSVLAGTTVSIFARPSPGWGTVAQKIQAGQIDQAAQSFIASWTGLKIGGIGGQQDTQFDFASVLNPFNMAGAPAMKTMLWTKLATKITKKLAGNPFTRIPFIKDYVSFS